jgi:DNA-binding transcriptional MocR family regulator
VSDRLPPQRDLAERLGINFTTVARGYVEAQKRGLIESRTGQGTFVAGQPRSPRPALRPSVADLTMNVAPEPEDAGWRPHAGRAGADRARPAYFAALSGLWRHLCPARGGAHFWRARVGAAPERLVICPGTHLAFQAILNADPAGRCPDV